MRIKEIEVRNGRDCRAEWDPQAEVLRVEGKGADAELVREVAECVLKATDTEKELFIPLKEASRRLNMCAPKLQGYARNHYKGCPAVLEGNKYLFNARLLPGWADRLTQDAIEGRA